MILLFWFSIGIIAYVLIVYPVILLLLSKFVSQPFDDQKYSSSPFVSLIIPAHNEINVIKEKLDNSLGIDYPTDKLEIIVGSDGSTDGTNEVVQSYADQNIKLLDFPVRRGKASVLNDSVKSAKGDILCMCDANVMFEPSALRRLINVMRDESIGAVTGAVILRSEESNFGFGEEAYYGMERRIQAAESATGSLMGVDGGMYAIRRDLFSVLLTDTILDDFVISMRVIKQGYRVAYEPRALASENGTPVAEQEWRRRVRVAAGASQSVVRGEFPSPWQPVMFWQYLSHKLLRWATPVLLVVTLATSAQLIFNHWIYATAFGLQCIAYAIALLGSFSIGLRQSRVGAMPFYFVMSNAAVLVGLVKGIFNLQPVTWSQADRS